MAVNVQNNARKFKIKPSGTSGDVECSRVVYQKHLVLSKKHFVLFASVISPRTSTSSKQTTLNLDHSIVVYFGLFASGLMCFCLQTLTAAQQPSAAINIQTVYLNQTLFQLEIIFLFWLIRNFFNYDYCKQSINSEKFHQFYFFFVQFLLD